MFYKPCPFKQQKVKRQRSFYMKTIERKRFKRTKMSRQPCLRFIDNCRKDCSMVCFHDFVSCTIPMCPPGWKKTKNKKTFPPKLHYDCFAMDDKKAFGFNQHIVHVLLVCGQAPKLLSETINKRMAAYIRNNYNHGVYHRSIFVLLLKYNVRNISHIFSCT